MHRAALPKNCTQPGGTPMPTTQAPMPARALWGQDVCAQRAAYTVHRTTHAVARDGAQTEILRVAIASELNIPTTELTAKSYPAAGGVTHTEETFDCGTHAAQATPAQLIDPNLELTVSDLPDGGVIHHQQCILRHTLVDHVSYGAAVSHQPGMQASGEHQARRPGSVRKGARDRDLGCL